MIFTKTKILDAYKITLEKFEDERGYFMRSYDKKTFEELNLDPTINQCSVSVNKKKGTLRGMHFQSPPFEETKLVRCTKGSVFEVIVDLRKKSPSYMQWEGFTISSLNYEVLYVPKGCAFGFITLEDDTEIFYQISHEYSAEHAFGIRWNDPKIGIIWPMEPFVISNKDKNFKDFVDE